MAQLINNPHDLFIRKTWERKDEVRSFIENHLPAEIVNCLNLETLKVEKDTFIDSQLKAHYSDILYSLMTKDGKPIKLYLLFEHKSYQDDDIIFQLLRYEMRILEAERNQNKTKKLITPILPLILYHGRTGWKLKKKLGDLYDAPEVLKPYLLTFEAIVFDFSKMSDEEIKGQIIVRTTLLLMKHIFDPDLSERLPNILGLMQKLSEKETALEYLEAVLKYLSSASDHLNEQDLERAVRTAIPTIGDNAMTTLAETWMAQGKQEGMQEEGINILMRLLKKKFGSIPEDAETRISEADSEQLLEWSENVLTAETVNEVFH
ncbi:MAG: Rpn family recombination-promoting nuclease/putative transposase [Methylococcales bacterium]|jgi:predicted transposase/invertase (TIGR01784 family)|nr:Rpn family recombination-promoting nuclease/putative transposase [Methylococcales bacterium]MBT7408527.1 Rpn family recombination-promoting nuclease/putative transposase [Methylococcales bacterium]